MICFQTSSDVIKSCSYGHVLNWDLRWEQRNVPPSADEREKPSSVKLSTYIILHNDAHQHKWSSNKQKSFLNGGGLEVNVQRTKLRKKLIFQLHWRVVIWRKSHVVACSSVFSFPWKVCSAVLKLTFDVLRTTCSISVFACTFCILVKVLLSLLMFRLFAAFFFLIWHMCYQHGEDVLSVWVELSQPP